MTKITKALPAEPTDACVDIRPDMITIADYGYKAWGAACALIRMGWTIDENMPPLALQNIGKATITLVRGKLDPEMAAHATEIAMQAEELATIHHATAYLRDVERAAVTAADTAQKAKAQALLDAEIAAQSAALDALKAAATAARV
jgi:hypothetical protein